jgi:hypothetical protein
LGLLGPFLGATATSPFSGKGLPSTPNVAMDSRRAANETVCADSECRR